FGTLLLCFQKGPLGGVNTNLSADGMLGFNFFTSSTEKLHRAGGRLESSYSGKLVRVNLTDFSTQGVEVLDLTAVDPDLRGFMGGFAAGHFGFLVPFKNTEGDGKYFGKFVRVDLLTFAAEDVTVR
ncbi:unnamed protein product, partial [Choristocarpus tenellus]